MLESRYVAAVDVVIEPLTPPLAVLLLLSKLPFPSRCLFLTRKAPASAIASQLHSGDLGRIAEQACLGYTERDRCTRYCSAAQLLGCTGCVGAGRSDLCDCPAVRVQWGEAYENTAHPTTCMQYKISHTELLLHVQ